MTYKFVDISSLFERFAIDAFDIVSGMKEAEKEYTGFFGDSPREIYAKVVQNKVETKVFVRCVDRHEYGFSDKEYQKSYTYYRYFLPLDALKELEKDFVSFEEKDRIENFLYKFGKFSDFDDFEFFHMGTLTSGDNKGLIGITDYGDEVRGKFFRPLRKGEGLTIKGIKVPVPDLNINPIPDISDKDVEEAQKNFEKEVEKYKKDGRVKQFDEGTMNRLFNVRTSKELREKIKKDVESRTNSLQEKKTTLPKVPDFLKQPAVPNVERQYSVYKDKLYRYSGDFKYDDQIEEILEEIDFELIAKMARIKYRDLESPKANYEEGELALILKNDAEELLRELVKDNCGRVSCGLFTAYNDGGVLSLEFTPEGWEASTEPLCFEEDALDLNTLKFTNID